MRVPPETYRALCLRAHELLSDAPMHDAWYLRLRGGPTRLRVSDVMGLLLDQDEASHGAASRFLFGVRRRLGRALGWDGPDASEGQRSYLTRLTDQDRSRSHDEPGSTRGLWTTLYTFDRESVGEVINRTVHAFLVFALEPADDGHRLYWGVHVKPVGRITPVYMALIDPFRRHVVYPSLIRRAEARWGAKTALKGPE